MRIQVLVATMHQTNHQLLNRMNIQSDAIVVNQCDRNDIEQFDYKGNTIKWLSLAERGVGLSRNTALMRASADIVLFADDDVYYNDNYEKIICDAFNRYVEADAIIFNLTPPEGESGLRSFKNGKRVRFFNAMRYGTVHLAVRLSRLRQENISFSLLFGGGAVYGSGEDTLFIISCLKHRFEIYTCTDYLGGMIARESSWFRGYNERFLFDKGALFYSVSRVLAKPLCLQLLLRYNKIWKQNGIGFANAYRHMKNGIREISKKTNKSNG